MDKFEKLVELHLFLFCWNYHIHSKDQYEYEYWYCQKDKRTVIVECIRKDGIIMVTQLSKEHEHDKPKGLGNNFLELSTSFDKYTLQQFEDDTSSYLLKMNRALTAANLIMTRAYRFDGTTFYVSRADSYFQLRNVLFALNRDLWYGKVNGEVKTLPFEERTETYRIYLEIFTGLMDFELDMNNTKYRLYGRMIFTASNFLFFRSTFIYSKNYALQLNLFSYFIQIIYSSHPQFANS